MSVTRFPTPGTILDASGNPYRAPRDPLTAGGGQAGARAVFRDLPVTPLHTEWTVDAIRAALAAHEEGMFQLSGPLANTIIGDDRVTAALGSRVGALLGLPTVYEQAEADSGGECLAAWREAWPKCHTPPEQGDVTDEIKRTAHVAGFAVAEIVWDTDGPIWQPYLKPWDTSHFYYDKARRCLIAMTEDGPEVVLPGGGKWFVHAPGGVWNAWRSGLITPLALPWFLKSCARRDWARYSERHGMPMILAEVPAVAAADDKKRFERELDTMGTEALVVLPKGMDGQGFNVKLLEAASQSWEGFDRLIQRCDNAITLCIQWQNLTTEVKEGSQAAARVHGDVKQTAVELDNRAWSDDVFVQLARPFAAWNFGDARRAARTSRDVTPLEDKLAETQALESFSRALAALRNAGERVDVAKLAAAYRVRLPLAEAEAARTPPIFAYHLAARMVTRNEARARVGLPPLDGPQGDELLGPPEASGNGGTP